MKKILVVDDDSIIAKSLCKTLTKLNYTAGTNGDGSSALRRIKSEAWDLILLDNKLPDMSGLDVLSCLKKDNIKLPVIIMTAYGSEDTVIEAMKLGAFDYIAKPFDLKELYKIIRKGLETYRLMASDLGFLSRFKSTGNEDNRMIGDSKKMQNVYKMVGQIADTNLTVLIRGESGTGKELLAKAIYQHSDRNQNIFLAVNCAAIPETLLESELLGYEKGAFTGAVKRKIGKFEQCDQGTIFLDEIGDMPLATQAKILRVLQQGEFERVGGIETIKVDVRVIAATNKVLEDRIEKGLFREDLYYRLEAVTIHLPPLRERMEDLKDLTEYFFNQYSKEINCQIRKLDPAVFSKLESYDWPGNIRELANTIKRAIALAKGEVLTDEYISFGGTQPNSELNANSTKWQDVVEKEIAPLIQEAVKNSSAGIFQAIINAMEKIVIKNILKETNWNQVQAASILGISRTTLRDKIKRYDI